MTAWSFCNWGISEFPAQQTGPVDNGAFEHFLGPTRTPSITDYSSNHPPTFVNTSHENISWIVLPVWKERKTSSPIHQKFPWVNLWKGLWSQPSYKFWFDKQPTYSDWFLITLSVKVRGHIWLFKSGKECISSTKQVAQLSYIWFLYFSFHFTGTEVTRSDNLQLFLLRGLVAN